MDTRGERWVLVGACWAWVKGGVGSSSSSRALRVGRVSLHLPYNPIGGRLVQA